MIRCAGFVGFYLGSIGSAKYLRYRFVHQPLYSGIPCRYADFPHHHHGTHADSLQRISSQQSGTEKNELDN
jgi:hypothetical protein